MDTTYESFEARKVFILRYFSFYEQLKFHARLRWAWEKIYNLGSRILDFGTCLTYRRAGKAQTVV